jgi:hypothetical protein
LAGLVRREGREVAGRGGIRAAAPSRLGSKAGKKKGWGEGEADRRGSGVGVRGKKKRRGA